MRIVFAFRPWIPATVAMVLMGSMFLLIYGCCNAVTAQRVGVGSFYFDWERRIPFVPAMIVPYMSVDLFFIGSFFLCRDRAELSLLSRRIALGMAISAAGFLLFPLRYGWKRPAVDGWLGGIFGSLESFDQPYNLCPSLHISLSIILWTVYGRRTGGWRRVALGTWFCLIVLSTLLVYQHHVVDVVGGWLAAQVCFALCREKIAPGPGLRIESETAPCLLTSPPKHPPPLMRSPPPFWRAWSGCWPVRAFAGWAADRTKPASAFTSPTTPATSTPSCSGPPCAPPPAPSPGPSRPRIIGPPTACADTSPPASSAPC